MTVYSMIWPYILYQKASLVQRHAINLGNLPNKSRFWVYGDLFNMHFL